MTEKGMKGDDDILMRNVLQDVAFACQQLKGNGRKGEGNLLKSAGLW